MNQFGISSCALNSELPVNSRCHIVQQFNSGIYDIIIASDELSLDDPLYASANKSNKIVIFEICCKKVIQYNLNNSCIFRATVRKTKREELFEESISNLCPMLSISTSLQTLTPTFTESGELLEVIIKGLLCHLSALERNVLWKQLKNTFTIGFHLDRSLCLSKEINIPLA